MFKDRQDAGRALAKRLDTIDPSQTVILALPRGGVPVALEICKATGAPLDLILVRKLGLPGHEELALGAIADGSEADPVINEDVAAAHGIPRETILAIAARESAELERRRTVYLGQRARVGLAGKMAIIVDDGIATGATAKAAIRAARARGAVQVVVAVPVAPREVHAMLKAEADDVLCLLEPEPFVAVGVHYRSFPQVSDDEVIKALAALD